MQQQCTGYVFHRTLVVYSSNNNKITHSYAHKKGRCAYAQGRVKSGPSPSIEWVVDGVECLANIAIHFPNSSTQIALLKILSSNIHVLLGASLSWFLIVKHAALLQQWKRNIRAVTVLLQHTEQAGLPNMCSVIIERKHISRITQHYYS